MFVTSHRPARPSHAHLSSLAHLYISHLKCFSVRALIVMGAAYVQCVVTLGDEATDTTAIVGPATLADTISIGGTTTFSGAVTLGDEATDTVTISEPTTLTDVFCVLEVLVLSHLASSVPQGSEDSIHSHSGLSRDGLKLSRSPFSVACRRSRTSVCQVRF